MTEQKEKELKAKIKHKIIFYEQLLRVIRLPANKEIYEQNYMKWENGFVNYIFDLIIENENQDREKTKRKAA